MPEADGEAAGNVALQPLPAVRRSRVAERPSVQRPLRPRFVCVKSVPLVSNTEVGLFLRSAAVWTSDTEF